MINNKCWLCERGTNLDDGGLQPGELITDFFGDRICIYCDAKIKATVEIMAHPEGIPLLFSVSKIISGVGNPQ